MHGEANENANEICRMHAAASEDASGMEEYVVPNCMCMAQQGKRLMKWYDIVDSTYLLHFVTFWVLPGRSEGFYIDKGLYERPRIVAVCEICTYLEPGMYLIAACLPSLRTLVGEICTHVGSGISSFRERHRGFTAKGSGRSDSGDSSTGLGKSTKEQNLSNKIDIKLTGIRGWKTAKSQSWAVRSSQDEDSV